MNSDYPKLSETYYNNLATILKDKIDWKKFSEMPNQLIKQSPSDKIDWNTKITFNKNY